MQAIRFAFLMTTVCAALTCAAQSFADLDPGLRGALLRDATCLGKVSPANEAQLSESKVRITNFRVDRQAEVIVVLQSACPCDKGNCATFVYLKSGDAYHLAVQRSLASLRPMGRGFHHGLPDLSGKIRVSDAKSETVVYEWNGSSYRPTLCAAVIQQKGHKRPAIVKHGCDKLPADQQPSSNSN
jgi:hypothetical protein